MQWLYELKNRTRHPQLRDSLEKFVCNLQEPHLHNFIEPIPNHVLQLLNVGGINSALNSGLSSSANEQFMSKKHHSKTRQGSQRRNNKFENQMQLTDEGHSETDETLENSASLKKKRALAQYQSMGNLDVSGVGAATGSGGSSLKDSNHKPVESHYIFGGPDSNSGMHNDYFDANAEVLMTHPVKMEDELELMKHNALYTQNNDILAAAQSHSNHLDNGDLMPVQALTIPVRLFLLKPERLPCHEELSDPTELPLSRDLMDARSSNVQVLSASINSANSKNSFSILLLILAIVYGTQVG